MWDNLNLMDLLAHKQSLIEEYQAYRLKLDYESCKISSSLIIYPEITLQSELQHYLNLKLPLRITRIIAQIRLLNKINTRIIADDIVYKHDNNSFCHTCGENDTLIHKILNCKIFSKKRSDLILPVLNDYKLDLFAILEISNKKLLYKFVALIKYIITH